jgi:hypothetical protein
MTVGIVKEDLVVSVIPPKKEGEMKNPHISPKDFTK